MYLVLTAGLRWQHLRLRNFLWVITGAYFVVLVYSGYVSRVDCGTAAAAFKNSKKWAGYSAI